VPTSFDDAVPPFNITSIVNREESCTNCRKMWKKYTTEDNTQKVAKKSGEFY
jgi:hypothetical protein